VQGAPGIALRAIDAVEGISSSAVLDRLIRGRVWIGLLAFALIGIVAMQLLVLELNTGIGRTLARVATLQRENAQLGIEDSTYSAESRIAPLAASAGMTLAPVGTIHFVAASPADVSRAAAALSTTVQAPASGQSGSAGTTSGEAATSSATTSPSTAATGETAGSTESSGSPSGPGG
jgi:cell division protein FtsL